MAQLFPLFCGLAVVGFSAHIRQLGELPYWFLGFCAMLLLTWNDAAIGGPLLQVEAQEIAVVAVILALITLIARESRRFALAGGGLMAAIWLRSLQSLSDDFCLPLLFVAAVTTGCFWAALKRSVFVHDELLDEAMVVLILAAALIGVVPVVISGWQAASALQTDSTTAGASSGATALILIALLAGLGVGYTSWREQNIARALRLGSETGMKTLKWKSTE